MRDPKFGYHWLWMLPLAIFAYALGKIIDTVARYRHLRRNHHAAAVCNFVCPQGIAGIASKNLPVSIWIKLKFAA